MTEIANERQPVCPHLPLEIWQRIFFYNTSHFWLWNNGRKVCSTWRSEIPKVLAKKYLENQDMVQVYFDCGQVVVENTYCDMVVEMVFDRYVGENKDRCVFTEGPATRGMHEISWIPHHQFSPNYIQSCERERWAVWQRNLDLYLGAYPAAKAKGGRFDLPPYQIQIKRAAADTELPKLEYDSKRKEISFEWQGMFDRFYSECEREAVRNDKDTRRQIYKVESQRVPKSIRRERIKKWYLEKHGRVFKDSSFDLAAEQKPLMSIESFRRYGHFERCAETVEELRDAASVWEHRDIYTGSEPDWEDQLCGSSPLEGPPFDEWGNELEEENEEEGEEEDEDLAGNTHMMGNGAPLRNDGFDAWGGLSDWEEEEQTW